MTNEGATPRDTDTIAILQRHRRPPTLITPEEARQYLSDFRYPRQRPLKPSRVAELVEAIRQGTFEPTEIRFAFCMECEAIWLINGQHRLTAIVEAETPAYLYITTSDYQTEADVDDAYGRLDIGTQRTFRDTFVAHGVDTTSGMSRTTLSLIGGAIPIIVRAFRPETGTTDRDVQLTTLKDYLPEGQRFLAAMAGALSRWQRVLLRAPVAAIALETFRYQPEVAATFWRRIADNDGLRKGTAEHTLVDFLKSGTVQEIGRNRLSRGVAVCWNAAFQQRPLSSVRVVNDTGSLLLLGTPYKGSR